jgi:hypothetical protein
LSVVVSAASARFTLGPLSPAPKTEAPAAIQTTGLREQIGALPEKPRRLWDRENVWLFVGVGASRTLDYFWTWNMRSRPRSEIFLTNDVIDDHAAFAEVEASARGVSMGAAYLFHRYEHHKLERWTSIAHMALTSAGSARNYCLKPAHVAQTPGKS